ncbi:MAG: type III-A CRISPR-associated RAMP protein Csm4 [Muribaculaceae bacterium]|nr:type III-A CRISPR-associated RAMP protein Csm4 [Muribaculaceae bacterium]
MMTFMVYKMRFPSGFHINYQRSDYAISQRTIQSDTIMAALTACLAQLGEEIPAGGDLGFAICSAFPFYQACSDSPAVYFLPKPMNISLPTADPQELKTLKKVKWVDAKLIGKVLAGGDVFNASTAAGEFLIDARSKIKKNFIHSEAEAHVVLKDRTGEEDAKPFFVDRVTFVDNSGLYFMATGDTSKLDRALTLLALNGIGNDRSSGLGSFSFEKSQIDIDTPSEADGLLSLSIFIPENKEQLSQMLNHDNVAFDFVRRGGWVTEAGHTSVRKNAIYGFLPGSVFRKCGNPMPGAIVDLRPSLGEFGPGHPIYRCGKGFMLPIKL